MLFMSKSFREKLVSAIKLLLMHQRRIKMSRYAFFLNSYNDIDNITPVIWKFLEKKEDIIVIFGTNYDYKNDYRIKYLQHNYNLKIFTFPSEYKQISMQATSRHIKYLLGLYGRHEKILKDHNISVCIFEWKVFYSSSLQNMLFGAAKNLKIPTIAIPHGVSIYSNEVLTKNDAEVYTKTGKVQQVTFVNDVDLFTEPNIHTQNLHIYTGGDPDISEVWGSARYYPKWAKINLEICPKFNANKSTNGKIKIVFMLPHWEYNVDVSETLSLIDKLADLSWVYLIIKDHTRGNGGLDDELRTKLNSLSNVEASVSAQSPALIQWSDAVINFGSSIGIEAILQDKVLINPAYLHTNQTIFEMTKSAFEPKNNSEVIEILTEIKNKNLKSIPLINKKLLLKEAVYGGKGEYDILEYYWKNISTIQSRPSYKYKPVPPHIIKVYRSSMERLKLKLPTIRMLMKTNPIKSFKYVMRWILHTYFDK